MMRRLPTNLRGPTVLAVGAVLIALARAQAPPDVVRQAGRLTLHQPVERELGPGMTKLEALRQAQLELLRGMAKPIENTEPVRGVIARPAEGTEGNRALPAQRFAADPQAPYAHPYYWAPFFPSADSDRLATAASFTCRSLSCNMDSKRAR